MPWYILAIDLFPLLVAACLGLLLHRLRRASQPDRAGETLTIAGTALATGNLIGNLALDQPPGWLPFVFLVPMLLLCFGLAVHRLRVHLPHMLGARPVDIAQQGPQP